MLFSYDVSFALFLVVILFENREYFKEGIVKCGEGVFKNVVMVIFCNLILISDLAGLQICKEL